MTGIIIKHIMLVVSPIAASREVPNLVDIWIKVVISE